jgi:hypothetical protein
LLRDGGLLAVAFLAKAIDVNCRIFALVIQVAVRL